jgi:hypothetical protein
MPTKRVRARKSRAGKAVKVKRKSKVNANTNRTTVKISLPGAVQSSGFGGGSSSSSSAGAGGSVSVMLPKNSGPQPSGAYDTYGNDFGLLRRDVAQGFESLFEQFSKANRGTSFSVPKPSFVEAAEPREGVQPDNVIPMDTTVEPVLTGFDISNLSNAGPLDGTLTGGTNASPNATQGLVQPIVALSDNRNQQREQAAQNAAAQNADRLYQQQTAVVDRMDVADAITPFAGVPSGVLQLANPQLRLQKRKPIITDARLAPEAQNFINNMSADTILNRDQNADYLRNQFNGGAALGIYQNRLSNNRFEKSSRLDERGNAFEIEQPRYPAIGGPPAENPGALVRYDDGDDDL